MEYSSSGTRIISNLMWRILERGGVQCVTLLVSIILARILTPEDYGQIALITVIISLLNVFVDGGLANALIQKKEVDNEDFTIVFWFNVLLCAIVYGIVFWGAPLVGLFYNDMSLVPLMRVLSLTIIISGIKNVQFAFVSRNLLFKKYFLATLIGCVLSSVVGVVMAFLGYGVWSIVVQHVLSVTIDTLILWIIVKWRPCRQLEPYRLRPLLAYGSKLLVSSFIYTLYGNFRQLLIGKYYSSSELGFYNRGKQFPNLLTTTISNSIDSVLFPVMSNSQEQKNKLLDMLKTSLSMSCYIMFPMLIGLLSIATPFVELIFTEKWLNCVPFLQVFCLMYLTYPLQTTNLNAIKALGRSDLYLKIEIVEGIYAIIMLVLAIKGGPIWIAIMFLLSEVLNCIVVSAVTKKLISFGICEQIKFVWKPFVASIIMGIIVYGLYHFFPMKWVVFIQLFSGITVYIILSKFMKIKEYGYIKETLLKLIRKQTV